MMGVFDYNWLGGFKTTYPAHDHAKAPWFGKRNVFQRDASLWDASKMPDFELPSDSAARRVGLNLARPVELRGRRFGPLPGMEGGDARQLGAY
jgi:hypothetical protein